MLHRDTGERTSFTHAEVRISSMEDRDLPDVTHSSFDQKYGDHWELYAEALDLTIEGHRLIAQEIAYEGKLLWFGAVSWLRDTVGTAMRRRSSPPV
jgi:hypothetical protein